MKRTTSSLIAAGVLLATVTFTGVALADNGYDGPRHMGRDHGWYGRHVPSYGPPGHVRGGMMGGLSYLADELDLSKEQREKIRDIVKKSRTQMRDLGESLGDNRDNMNEIFNEKGHGAEFDKLAHRQGELIGEMIILRAKTRAQIEGVLTAEQKERFRDYAGDVCEYGPGYGWRGHW